MPRASFYAKSQYFDEPLSRAGALDDGELDRAPPAPPAPARARCCSTPTAAPTTGRPPTPRRSSTATCCSRSSTAPTSAAAAARAANRWINGVWRALRPFASGQAYQNYIDPQLRAGSRPTTPRNLPRLRQIKKQVDPDFRFRFKQAIPPRGADGPRLAEAAARAARLPALRRRRPRSRASRTRCSPSAWCCSCSTAPGAPALAGATVAAITLPEPDHRPAARAPGSTSPAGAAR